MQVATVSDQPDRHALVQQEREHRPRRSSARPLHRVPEMRREAGAGSIAAASSDRWRSYGRAQRRSRRRQPLDRRRARAGARARASPAGRPPLDAHSSTAPRSTGVSSSTGIAPAASGIQERPFQMEAEAQRVVHLLHASRSREVAGHARSRRARGVVDLQVDEAREDERILGSALAPLDRGDGSVLHRRAPREGALDRVNEKSL